MVKVAEYKRTCNECSKMWHSLVEREAKVGEFACCDEDKIGNCSTCGETSNRNAQYRKNIQSKEDTLSQLRRCPQCGSTNFKQEIVYYEKLH